MGKQKMWTGLFGSLASALVPLVLSVATHLPFPFGMGIGAVLAVLTALGIYHVPNK